MRFWIAVAVLLGLAALGLAAGPRMVDWNGYRGDIEKAAARLTGHEVTIGGPIELSLLPRPVLTARDVTLTASPSDAVGFTLIAGQAEVVMEIGPLLAGRTVMRDLRLSRPVLTIDAGPGQRLRSWPPRWRDWAAPFQGLDLKAIAIADGRIALAGERQGDGLSLNDLSMNISIGGRSGPVEAAGLFTTRRHRFTMTAAFGRPDDAGISAARISIEAENGDDETTDLRFSGRLHLDGDDQGLSGRLSLEGPDLQHGLAAIASATGYPSTFASIAEGQPFAAEGRIEADRNGVRTDELQLRLSEKLGKGQIDLRLHPQTRLDLKAEVPTLRLADSAARADFLPLDLLSKLQVPPGEIDLGLRELLYRGEAARRAGVRLTTGADGVTAVENAKVLLPGLVDLRFEGGLYAGEIGPRLRGRLNAVGDDLGSSLAWLGLIDEERRNGGWRGFSLESDVDVSSVEIALSAIDLRLDSASLGGKASLRFSERRRLSVDVDIARPDLDLYFAGVTAGAAAAGLAARLEWLDADVDARLERLTWRGVHVDRAVISASAEQGRLALREIAATTVGETNLALEGEIDLDSEDADLAMTIESEHPMRALRHWQADLPLTSSRPLPLALNGAVSGTFERFDLEIEADYDGGGASAVGAAGWRGDTLWHDLTMRARHPDHQALLGQFGLAPLVAAGDAEGAFELEGRLRHEPDVPWVASGSVKLGPTSFTGSLGFEEGPLAGPFDARLSVGSPQKDSLTPLLIASGLRLAGDWTPARWLGRLPSVGLRTAWLEKAEGTLSLMSKGGLAGDGLTMRATLSDGLLYVDQFEASPWQGGLQAELTLERRRDRPFAAVAVELDQVEAAAFAAWLGVKSGISGPLDLRLEASSIGSTPYEMMAGLAGELSVTAGPGEIEGLGIAALKETLTPDDEGGGAGASLLTLPFTSIETTAGLSRGILTFEDGRLTIGTEPGEGAEAAIGGTVDLLLWIADLTLTAGGSQGDDPAAGIYRVLGPPDRPVGRIADGN